MPGRLGRTRTAPLMEAEPHCLFICGPGLGPSWHALGGRHIGTGLCERPERAPRTLPSFLACVQVPPECFQRLPDIHTTFAGRQDGAAEFFARAMTGASKGEPQAPPSHASMHVLPQCMCLSSCDAPCPVWQCWERCRTSPSCMLPSMLRVCKGLIQTCLERSTPYRCISP